MQNGISNLPDGQEKKQQLQKWLSTELRERFRDTILDITIGTAYVWGQVLVTCEKNGITLPAIDSLIASHGIINEMTIVTRNVVDREPSGALLFSPCVLSCSVQPYGAKGGQIPIWLYWW
jgi:predicted nucleic acid-binding protein